MLQLQSIFSVALLLELFLRFSEIDKKFNRVAEEHR